MESKREVLNTSDCLKQNHRPVGLVTLRKDDVYDNDHVTPKHDLTLIAT